MDGNWEFAINIDEIDEEDVMPVEIGDLEIAVYKVKGKIFATADLCTHGQAYLSEGIVVGEVIECPLHQGRFCLKTGRALSAPVSDAVNIFETKVVDDKIFVRMGEN